MKVLSSFLAISFISIAVFGFVGMGHFGSHDSCLAAAANLGCLDSSDNSLAVANFHIETFKKFSTATLNLYISVLLLSLLFFIILEWFKNENKKVLLKTALASYTTNPSRVYETAQERKIIDWLTLHQKRDPYKY